MAIVRIGREEMKAIVDVAERMAHRMNTRFVVDQQKVEILDEPEQLAPDHQANNPQPLDLR